MKRVVFFLFFCSAIFVCFPPVVFADTLTTHVTGISGEAQKNIEQRLTVLQKQYPPNLTKKMIEHFYKQAPQQIQLALQPFGYFYPTIGSRLTNKNHEWQALFVIYPGPPVRLQNIRVQIQGPGRFDPALNKLLRKFPLQTGQVLNIPAYQRAKQQLFNIALAQGYLNAAFTKQQIRISLKHFRYQIILQLNTGPRFYFNGVYFNHVPLSEQLLQRYVPFKPGDPFSSQQLNDLQNSLNNSPYFSSVRVTPQLSKTPQQYVPVKVKLQMRKKQQLNGGIGYGTDTGPRISFGSQSRYINQEGHGINTQMMLSPVQSVALASYTIPGKNPAIDQYSFTGSVVATHLNQGTSRAQILGANAIKQLTPDWQRTFSLNYQVEQFKFNQQVGQTSHLFIPGARLIYLHSNNPTFPTRGNRFLISTQGTVQGALSDNRFWQAEIQDKYITHFTKNDRLILRGDFGYSAIHNLSQFPLSLRFYAGGSQSVRGFAYQGLGPGKYLAVASAEWQQRIVNQWYGAVFYDVGNAMDHWQGRLPYSTGVGLVWASPIGTMELTLAKVWSLPDQPMRIQFVIGPDL